MTLYDHFWVVTWNDDGEWRDALFDSEGSALWFAGKLDVEASIHPPEPAWRFVECDEQPF